MEIKELKARSDYNENKQLFKYYDRFERLILAIKQKEITDEVANDINIEIDAINSFNGNDNELKRMLRRKTTWLLKILAQKLKLVHKNHYRDQWIGLGMAIFGVPLGVAFGTAIGNMGMLGVGLPIGIPIGMAVGMRLDKKALEQGRQLDFVY